MRTNMQIRSWSHLIISDLLWKITMLSSPKVARSAVGKFPGKLQSFYYYYYLYM